MPDRAAARACTLANLLVLPGLGSLSVGRRVGWVQAALALVGLALTLGGFLRALLDLVAAISTAGGERLGGDLVAQSLDFAIPGAALLVGVTGVVMSLAAWLWALATSFDVHREVRQREQVTARTTGTPPVLP